MRPFSFAMLLSAFVLLMPAAHADLLGPTPYKSFADSPWNGAPNTYFHLETFEDGLLNTPGVTASTGSVLPPSGITDSVDGDDGSIDGSGNGGHSFFTADGAGGITFTFDKGVLGSLPNAAGIVWTDGTNTILFKAYDQNGNLIGTLSSNTADNSFDGETGEDRFFGATNAGGISKIFIQSGVAPAGLGGGMEVDHLQYGLLTVAQTGVPEPSSLYVAAVSLILVAFFRLRRRTTSQ